MLTVMSCPRSHFVHAVASSRDVGCRSGVIVRRFHPLVPGELVPGKEITSGTIPATCAKRVGIPLVIAPRGVLIDGSETCV